MVKLKCQLCCSYLFVEGFFSTNLFEKARNQMTLYLSSVDCNTPFTYDSSAMSKHILYVTFSP